MVRGISLEEGRSEGSSTNLMKVAVIFDAFEPPEGSSEDHASQNVRLAAVRA